MSTDTQQKVKQFTSQHDLECELPFRLLDLVSELGEVSKELLKRTDYGKKTKDYEQLGDEWEDELGDLYFTLVCIANATNIDLDDCLNQSLQKYRKRLGDKGTISSG